MRVSSLGVARPAYYDRNAVGSYQTYSATLGPHNFTNRFSYTVPTGKKLLLESASIEVVRATAATIAGVYYGRLGIGGVYTNIVEDNTNTVGFSKVLCVPSAITGYAGETWDAYTSDQSTGGTILYAIQTKATIFDA